MQDATKIELIRSKYIAMVADLDERGRRRWAAVEARALGHGGITTVATAIGMSDRTIRRGMMELKEPEPLSFDRQRRVGAGRKSYRLEQPGLVASLDRMIDPTTRGSPMSPLRWTCKSTRSLTAALVAQGFKVSASRVRQLLVEMGYSLQANRKTLEGRQHPDRDGQFRYINGRVLARKRRREPAISVDTKKKEVLGNHKNPGRTYRPKGRPIDVDVHDFPERTGGKAVPYGV